MTLGNCTNCGHRYHTGYCGVHDGLIQLPLGCACIFTPGPFALLPSSEGTVKTEPRLQERLNAACMDAAREIDAENPVIVEELADMIYKHIRIALIGPDPEPSLPLKSETVPTQKIKILFRKNLKMSPGKLAAQSVHAALGLSSPHPLMSVVVLGVSDAKFEENKPRAQYLVRDAGYTEVPAGTETCLAFYEDNHDTF